VRANSTVGSVRDKEKAIDRVSDRRVQGCGVVRWQGGDERVDGGARKGRRVGRQKRGLGRAGVGRSRDGRCSGRGRARAGIRARWWLGVDGTRNPGIIIMLDAKGRAEGVMQ